MNIHTKRLLNIKSAFLLLLVVGLLGSLTFLKDAKAATYTPSQNVDCIKNEIDASSTVASGTGYIYRTVEIDINGDSNTVGTTVKSDDNQCKLNGNVGNTLSILEWYGLHADQIWFGPTIPGAWTPGVAPYDQTLPTVCENPTPSPGHGDQCSNTTGNNDWEVFQDDAHAIYFNGNRISCNGMINKQGELPDGGCGNDIYAKNTEDDLNALPPASRPDCKADPGNLYCPLRGAGFFNIPPQELTSLAGTTGGIVNDIPLSMWARSTWKGGFGVHMVLSMRYPRRAVVLDPSCSTKTVSVKINPPGGGTPISSYYVDGAYVNSFSGTSYSIPMSAYNQLVPHTVQVLSTSNGVAMPPGDAIYGPCPPGGGGPPGTKACPNFPGGYTWTFSEPPPPSEWMGSSYQTNVYIEGQLIDSGSSLSGTTPNGQIPNQFKDADIHSTSGDGTATQNWRVYDHTEYYSYTDPVTGETISGSYPVYNYYSQTVSLTFTGGPYPSGNRGCYDRTFTASATLSNARLTATNNISSADKEEPAFFTTLGQINVNMQTASNEGTPHHPLVYTPAQQQLTVTGPKLAVPGTSTSGYTYTTNGNYTFADIGLREYWPINNPKAGDTYCAKFDFKYTGNGILDVFGNAHPEWKPVSEVHQGPLCETVVDRPYLKAFMGDIRAEEMLAWSRSDAWFGANKGFRGSSAEYGVLAFDDIDQDNLSRGIYSASLRDQNQFGLQPAIPPKGLTFANDNTTKLYGGNLIGSAVFPNYYSDTQNPDDIPGGSNGQINLKNLVGPGNISKGAKGKGHVINGYKFVGPPGDVVIPTNSHVTIYVDNDITISNNIVYSAGPYATRKDIPYFTLIACGNIRIESNVTRVDGLLVAQKTGCSNPNGGVIYTCSEGDDEPGTGSFNNGEVVSTCNKKLTINGALLAQDRVEFWRTPNSLRNSRNNYSGNPERTSMLGVGGWGNNAAEEINLTPEVLFGEPNLKSTISSSSLLDFEAFSSLPPIY